MLDDDDDELDAEGDDDSTVECPYCQRSVYDDAEQCPSCGSYLSEVDSPQRRPWWLVLGVVAGLAAAFAWVIHRW